MIDRIKISKEYSSNSGNIWLGAEATVIEGQTAIEEGLKVLGTLDELYLKMGGESTAGFIGIIPTIQKSEAPNDLINDAEFNQLKESISKIGNREDAQEYLDTTDFRYTVEAKNLINIKPSKHEKK